MPDLRVSRKIYDWRIRANLICILVSVVLSRPRPLSLLAGGGFIALGLLLRAWAAGHLWKSRELTVSGPYRHTRNPLYLGSLIIGIGAVAACRSWWVLGLFALYFLVFYPVAIRLEKQRMLAAFPEAYREYSRSVPLFFPRLKPGPGTSPRSFDRSLFRRNKEKRASLGALFFLAALLLKMWLF
jgi:protein-S-isoprenylcysteine O-methyltransferase Ste14